MPDAEIPQEGSETPKQFIRTFAADIAAVQAGDTPELQPFASPTETVEPAALFEQVPSVAAVPTPPPPPAPTLGAEEDKEIVLARLRAKVAASSSSPVATPPQSAPPLPTSSPLHTYSSDFREQVQGTHASTASILAAEQDGGPVPTTIAEQHSKSGLLFIASGIALLLLGGAGAYVAFQVYQNRPLPVVIAPTVTAPIFVDERAEVSGTSTALARQIVQSLSTPLASDGVRFLYTVTSTSTDQSVFSALQLPAPGVLLRNIDATGSMAGIVQLRGVSSVFFILTVQSYSDTFAGMLSWENTMPRDMEELFPSYAAPGMQAAGGTTAATSTTASGTQKIASSTAPEGAFTVLYKAGFFDEVVASHDARAYHNTAGNTLIIYSYANPNTLIIARNEEALTEILSRINTSRSK